MSQVDVLTQNADAAVATGVTTWKLDASHSEAGFTVRHMMITNVRGRFSELEGTLELDRDHLENAKVEVKIKTASIDTRDANRDAHLKSADFFESEVYPDMTFTSSKFVEKGDGEIEVVGDLTIRDITKPVTLKIEGPTEELKDPWGGTRIGFAGTTKLNRKDFGLNWNVALEAGGFLVSDEIKIFIEAEFVKQ